MIIGRNDYCSQHSIVLRHIGIHFSGSQNFFFCKLLQPVFKSNFQKMGSLFYGGGIQQIGTLPDYPVSRQIGHKKSGICLFLFIDEKSLEVRRNLGEDRQIVFDIGLVVQTVLGEQYWQLRGHAGGGRERFREIGIGGSGSRSRKITV